MRSCLTFTIVRLSGVYTSSRRFATTPSSPAPSNVENHDAATSRSVLDGVRNTGAPTAQLGLEQRMALTQRHIEQRPVTEGEEVERHERRRRLPGQHPHA